MVSKKMGNKRTVELSKEEIKALEKGYRSGTTQAFRKRCQLILLKTQGRTSKDVGKIIAMKHISVHNWLDRYQAKRYFRSYYKIRTSP